MTLLEYIYDDTYLKSLFEQVHVRGNGEFVLVPRVGGHLVELGYADDLDRKFRHLQALYEDGFNGSDWRKYKYVSLKFRNQIVCTRN
jgi:cell division protein FtsQ